MTSKGGVVKTSTFLLNLGSGRASLSARPLAGVVHVPISIEKRGSAVLPVRGNEKLQIRVSGFSYTKNLIDSSCLISVKLKDKNLIYNKTIFKRLFNLGPDYLLVDSFQRNLEIYKALNSLLIDYDFNFEKEVIKV